MSCVGCAVSSVKGVWWRSCGFVMLQARRGAHPTRSRWHQNVHRSLLGAPTRAHVLQVGVLWGGALAAGGCFVRRSLLCVIGFLFWVGLLIYLIVSCWVQAVGVPMVQHFCQQFSVSLYCTVQGLQNSTTSYICMTCLRNLFIWMLKYTCMTNYLAIIFIV